LESLETKDERQAKRKAVLEIALHEALFGAARELLKDGPPELRSRQKGQPSSRTSIAVGC